MNLFSNIVSKAKTGANYLASGQLGSDIFDATRNEDPTQNIQFKAIQGGANLYTGVKNRIQETAQQDKIKFDAEIAKKRQQFIGDMLAQGKKKEDIFSALDSLQSKGEFEYKPGIASSIVGGIGNRMQTIEDTTGRLSNIQNPIARTVAGVAPYAGQTVASVFQPVTSALEPFVSPVVQKVIEKTGQTENVQALSQGWSEFEKTNPILTENIAGLLNVSQLAPVPFAKPIGNAVKKGAVSTGKAIVRGAEVVAPKVVQGVKTGMQATGEGVGNVTKSIVSQQSGLGTPAIESILKNPELQSKIRSGELSGAKTLEEARSSIDALREGYRETGKMYDTVRKSNIPVAKNEAKQVLVSQLESEGLATGGKLNLVDLPVKDRGAITQALKYIDEYGDTMTPQNALSIRQKLDDLINYKSDVGSNGQRIVQGLRAKYDEFLGNKLPGLKEIDTKYAPERQFWESIRKDIYKADGTLKDNALSVVSNITNKGNEARLARMEQILPGIGERVKALKAFEDVQNASGIKIGNYTRAATTGGLALVNPAIAIATWVATHPIVVSRVLESIGLATHKIKSIISKGNKITPDEVKVVQEAIKKVPKSEVENIINNLSYNPKTSKLTSKTLSKNDTSSIVRPVVVSNKGDNRKLQQVTHKSKSNAKQQVNKPISSDTIPEGYFKNAFGEIQKNPTNKTGGFIRNPFAKPEPKRLFAGENSAQPPSKKTGWFKGADGKMRFEIDDSQANLLYKDKEIYTNDPITTLLDHKELYKQYPELKDVKVTIYSPMSKEADSISANYNSDKNLIMVNREKIKSPEGLKSSLLHEIQHAIQNKEGFARGGNMEMFTSDKNLQKLNTELSELMSDKSKMSAIELKEAYGTKGVDHYIDKIKDELSKFDETGKHGLYKRLSGEVEARNVQSRMGLSSKERTIKKPESTEDVPRAKQIIRMDSKGPSLLKIPEIGKKVESIVKNPLVEEARIPKELKKIFTKDFSLEKLKKGITIKMSPSDLYKYQDTKVMNSSIADGEISSSIRNNGYYNDSPVSLVISSDGKVIQLIDGNGRVTAAKDIGLKEIPVNVKLSSWDSSIIKKNFGQRAINKGSIDISKFK